MKMNTKEKVQFIRSNHPQLYKKIEEMGNAIIKDDWVPSQEEIASYNETVKKYCDDYTVHLFNMLKIE